MKGQRLRKLLAIVPAIACVAVAAYARQDKPHVGYKDTPFLPGGKWRVHDGDRPQPPIIEPGTASTQDAPGKPPSDAIVLFDGKDTSKWKGDGGDLKWKVEDGAMVVGGGRAVTKDEFGDCQLHIEWTAPNPPKGKDQGRGNSGVEMFGRYEIQVLDCFDNMTYADGSAGAVYGQFPPLVNPCRKPGEWNTYDLIFNAPKFKEDGSVETPAYVTLLFNGVVVQNHTELIGAVAFRNVGKYSKHGPKGPIALQDHGNPVRYRNIWVRELKDRE